MTITKNVDYSVAAWIAQTKQGLPHAFNPVVEQFERPIYRYCYRLLGDAAAAEDATQEVFLRAFSKLESYDETRRFSTWLYAIASNYCRDQIKKRRLRVVSWDETLHGQTIPSPESLPETLLMQAELTGQLAAMLHHLPSEHRTAIILKYWHKMSYSDIADTLDLTVSAVKSKLFRARRMLAEIGVGD